MELLEGRVRSVEYSGGQVIVDAPRRGRVYLPGSFNPLHEGHRCAPGSGPSLSFAIRLQGCFTDLLAATHPGLKSAL